MSERILIVEDERITAEDLRDILEALGYCVTGVVSSGDEAIAAAGETSPDLALMDIRIKGAMDGAETARILRERFNIPVIYLTAHADRATLDKAKQAQPLGYITKPFQESELHASIEIALHKHRADLKALGREKLLESTFGAMGEGVISLDRFGAVTLLNGAAQAWTGWSASEAVGRPLGEVFRIANGAGGQEVDAPLASVLNDGALEELREGSLLASRQGGKKKPVTGSIAPIRDHRGKVAGAVVVFGAANDAAGARRKAAAEAGLEEDGLGFGSFKIVAASPSMKQVLRFARRIAESEASTILLEGESGTGKDVMARFIHHFGKRREGPFVALNCAAIPETLLESELFGHEKGAFTDARASKAGILELATGGAMFLDEIGEMPMVLQAKLLRVLEEQAFRRLGGVRDIQVDVRVIAATNRKLTETIEQGKFRLDLYYRLNVIQICLPPLRDRKEDILPLAEYFIRLYNPKFKRDIQGLSPAACETLIAYDWPGNVRELRNMIERAMVFEETDWVQPASLQMGNEMQTASAPESGPPPAGSPPAAYATLEEAERDLVSKALEKCRGNQTRAAVMLGITRDALRYKMKKFNLR
jgi:PAS domain S-box-containing protein